MGKRKKRISFGNIILVLTLLIGLSLLVYPSFSDYWNSFHQTRAISSYIETVSKIETSEYDAIMASARKYNEDLNTGEFRWFLTDEQKEAYNAELNVDDYGAMGFLTIDKIHVQLPIYHGTSESVLQTSIGHIEWSSLPTGGEGTHCLFSGHRGLPSARLFTDLDKLNETDIFQLSILNETLTYQIDQIRVVVPSDLSTLQIDSDKDYCTLFTCTPYGVNTHRLMVRGHRVANQNTHDVVVLAEAMQLDQTLVALCIAAPLLILLFVATVFRPQKKRGRRSARAAAS